MDELQIIIIILCLCKITLPVGVDGAKRLLPVSEGGAENHGNCCWEKLYYCPLNNCLRLRIIAQLPING